jgi:GntR family transcriptional regulator/MocR family aminotransferase
LRRVNIELLAHRWAALRNACSDQPLNRLLYDCLRVAVLDGSLAAGVRLPASRDLAREFALARNTVMHAYAQLTAEGYLSTLTGSGTYVASVLPERSQQPAPVHLRAPGASAGRATGSALSVRGQALAGEPRASVSHWGAFVPGVPDVTEFPHRRFAQLLARWQRHAPPEWRSYVSGGGHPALRAALVEHLRETRSVHCEPDQIVIAEGSHQAIDLVTRLMADANDLAWVEEPGYWGLRGLLEINGLRVRGIPVDSEGMAPRSSDWEQAPRLVFVTPSHQYPLGSVMSLRRRLDLLEQARRHDSWIVEDDYDSEFRYAGRPIAALQGLRPDARVIYIGTFSKTAYPGLRIAYLVLPHELASAFRAAYPQLYRQGNLATQAALAEFMQQGHYASHVRRMRLIYAARRAALLALIERHLGPGWVHPCDSPAGLHLVLRLPDGVDDLRVKSLVAQSGVIVRALSDYCGERGSMSGLLLGFAGISEPRMLAPFQALVTAIRQAGTN